MSLFAAVQPLVMTFEGYRMLYGEDDPEELAVMQVTDRQQAEKIGEVLRDLFGVECELARPRDDEGPSEELGETDQLHELRRIAAAVHGKTPDDYYEGRVALGHPFNHLINHSDEDGFYLPVRFEQTFFIEETSVGSSVVLLEELNALEPILASQWPDLVALVLQAGADRPVEVAGPVGLWGRLRRLCEASVDLGLPVHFG
jgi:hypothetical protein